MIFWRFKCEKPSVSYRNFENNKNYTWYEFCEFLEQQYFGYIVKHQLYSFDCACFVAMYEGREEFISPFFQFQQNKDYFLILKRTQRETRRKLYLSFFGKNWWGKDTVLSHQPTIDHPINDDDDNDIENFILAQQPQPHHNQTLPPSYINVTNEKNLRINNNNTSYMLRTGGQSTVLIEQPRTKDGRICKRLYSTLKGKVKRMLTALNNLPQDMNLEQFVVYRDEKDMEFIDTLQIGICAITIKI
jgi:hypothetical protein